MTDPHHMRDDMSARAGHMAQETHGGSRRKAALAGAVALAALLAIFCLAFGWHTGRGSDGEAADLPSFTRTETSVSAVGAEATGTAPALSEAKAAIVVDEDGRELWGTNEDEELPMASITKIMTAMVVLDSGVDLSSTYQGISVTLEEGAVKAGYSEADTPSVKELLQVMLVASANDAAENLAVDIAGSREAFVGLMNEKAEEIGMAHTHFMNPTGLEEDGHYSCVSDLVLMGRYALEHYPLIAQTIRLSSAEATISGKTKTMASTDSLLHSLSGMLGIKTGSVESGTGFLGAYEKDGTRIYTCVLGCTTEAGRFTDTERLISWTYSQGYVRKTYATTRIPVATVGFADHFGLVLDVSAMEPAIGYVWPGSDGVEEVSAKSTQTMSLPGALWGSSTWTQAGRCVASAAYVASSSPHPDRRTIDEKIDPLEARICA